MQYNYDKLSGKIVEKFGSQSKFATAMGLSERSISLKMGGKRGWKQPEITLACTLLDIPQDEVHLYFFMLKVQSVEQIA